MKYTYAITTFLLLMTTSVSAQNMSFSNSSKKYKDKYKSHLNDGEKVKKSWYHYVTTETEEDEHYVRVFYPDTKQIISYHQFESDDYKIKSGISKHWTDNGILTREGFYKNNKEVGLWKIYNRYEGYLREIGTYKEGRKIGVWNKLNSDGDTTAIFTYDQGVKHGPFIVYDSLGQIYNQGIFSNDTILSETLIDTITKVELKESFPMFKMASCDEMESYKDRKQCADNHMLQYIYKNLRYPSKARELSIEGRVITQFTVTKEGKIEDINVLRGICDELKNECIRVIKNMPDWNPGTQDDRPVKVMFTLPIKFKLR